MQSKELAGDNIQIERKRFAFSLMQNESGCVLRIREEAGNRRTTIMVPASGIGHFAETLARIARKTPAASLSPPKKSACAS